MTALTRRAIIVIPAAKQAAANAKALNVDPVGGAKTFTAGLAQPANPTVAVAYWCSWALTPAQATALQSRMDELADNNIRVFNGNQVTPDDVLAQLGLVRVQVNQ